MGIRTLRRDEPIPTAEPRRYRDSRGYVRLRWLVGPDAYVEDYEHRVVMGRPDGEVHHRNGDKADNDPSNLVVLTKAAHAELHAEVERKRRPPQGRTRDRERRQRIQAREDWWAGLAVEYAAGASHSELARRHGLHASNVSRGLRARGVVTR